MRVPSIAGRLTPATRPAALICVVMAGTGLIASIALAWPSADGQLSFAAMLPQFAALFALASAMLSLFSNAAPAPTEASATGEPPAQQVSALQSMVWELRGILAEEKIKLATFQEVCGATAHDANVMSSRMARLAEASVEAEQRLVAGAATAEKSMRQPAAVVTWAAEAVQRVERALPELADVIRTSIAAQSDVLAPALESAANRMVVDAGSALQVFHTSVATAAAIMNALGGRVGEVDAALAQLPAAAATVTAAADRAAFTLAEASAALCADGASLGATGRETVQAAGALREQAETLRATGQEIAGVERETITNVTSTIAAAAVRLSAVIADADAARHGSVSMIELTGRLEAVAATLEAGTTSLDAAGQRIVSTAEVVTGCLDTAGSRVIASAHQAMITLTEASAVLSEKGAALGTAGREAEQAVSAVRQEAENLRTIGQDVAVAESEAIRHVANTTEATATRLAEVIADADAARKGAIPMVVLTAQLEHAATTLAENSHHLNETSKRIASAGNGVAERLDDAVATLAEATATISTGGLKLDETSRETVHTAAALRHDVATIRAAVQDIAAAEKSAIAAVTGSAEAAAAKLTGIIADADTARQGSVKMVEVTSRLEQAAMALADGSASLDSAGHRLVTAVNVTAGRIDTAAANVTAAADQALANLAEASAVLCADSASLDASGQETLQTAAVLRQEAEILRSTAENHLEAHRQTMDAAVTQMLSALTDNTAHGAKALRELSVGLEHTAVSLDAARQRFVDSGDAVTERLAASISRLDALPDVAADMTSAVSGLQVETSVLAAVAQQVSTAGTAAAQAVNDIASRVEVSTASLDTVGRLLGASAGDVAAQIDRLSNAADRAEAQSSLLPETRVQITQATDRLRAWADALPSETALAALPATAARLEAALPGLDHLDALAKRLEHAVAALSPGEAQSAMMATLSGLSADISTAVSRVETALTEHDKAGAFLLESVSRVHAAAETSHAAAEPYLLPEGVPVVLATTLRDLDGMAAQSETLLKQTEALAEAVMKGLAPTLPSLLGNRTPAILAGVEATIKRLASVATALALASDGQPSLTPSVIRRSA